MRRLGMVFCAKIAVTMLESKNRRRALRNVAAKWAGVSSVLGSKPTERQMSERSAYLRQARTRAASMVLEAGEI
jgi:hypothetical protein